MSVELPPDVLARRRGLFQPCLTRAELHAWIYVHLDVDLPGTIVYERSDGMGSNTTPLDMCWDIYSRLMYPTGHEDTDPAEMLFYASRFGGKTLGMSILEVLAMLHVRTNSIHLAALEQQSLDAQGYLKNFFYLPDLRGLMVGDNKRETEVEYFEPLDDGPILFPAEFKQLDEEERKVYVRVAHNAVVIVATLQSANGKHGGFLILDELDILRDPRGLAEAKNIPVPIKRPDGTFTDPLTVYTSTRKTAFGPVQRAINEAAETGLIVKHFNILEVTQRCPTSRHLPDQPRIQVYRSDDTLRTVDPATYEVMSPKQKQAYVKDEAYAGCMSNCRIFASCRGNLATRPETNNEFLKPLSDTVKKLRTNALDYARSQLLCLKPSSVGLIYGHLIEAHHLLSPAQCYLKVRGKEPPQGDRMTKAELVEFLKTVDVQFGGGQDYGFGHDFAFVVGFGFGANAYVLNCRAAPGLDPGQKLEYSEPLHHLDPEVYGDTEDPGMIEYFRKHKWRMKDWVKGKGSVKTGIDIVKDRLAPVEGDPNLYFVFDDDDDQEMGDFVQKLREHPWKLDAFGRPTDTPSEVNKDVADALRYWIMNKYPHRRGQVLIAGQHATPAADVPAPVATPSTGGPSEEMRAIMAGLLGGSVARGRKGGPKGGRLKFVS